MLLRFIMQDKEWKNTLVFIVQREAPTGSLLKYWLKEVCETWWNLRSQKEDSMAFQGHLHAGNRPGKAVEGGTHLSVDLSYQVAPNTHTKCVLLSKMWSALDSYLTSVFLSDFNWNVNESLKSH